MKNIDLFKAASICLTAVDAESDAKTLSAWTQDSRFIPLIEDDSPTHPLSESQAKKLLDEILKEADDKRTSFWFGICTLDKSEMLGIAARMVTWQHDSEYARLMDSEPIRLWNASQNTAWIEKQQKGDAFTEIEFAILALNSHKVIGSCGLDGISWHNRTSWVGIGIGERDYWGKGYGTEAMQILARYAFEELGLYRLNLNVFSYNTRAIKSYEKVGYVAEGKIREAIHRDDKRWDVIFMGLLAQDFRPQLKS